MTTTHKFANEILFHFTHILKEDSGVPGVLWKQNNRQKTVAQSTESRESDTGEFTSSHQCFVLVWFGLVLVLVFFFCFVFFFFYYLKHGSDFKN